jgi:hypothetical protein
LKLLSRLQITSNKNNYFLQRYVVSFEYIDTRVMPEQDFEALTASNEDTTAGGGHLGTGKEADTGHRETGLRESCGYIDTHVL